jgi:protein involved in polysaccharide export with SLBB domain
VNWADQSGVELLTTVVDGQTGRAATQRQSLPLRQGTLASYIVRPRDQIRFNRVFNDVGGGSVALQGEVRFAGAYPIVRGERLSELLMRAGGLTATAYPAGTVYLRKSAAQVERDGYIRAANEIQDQLLVGMARVGNDKIPPETFQAMQGFINRLRTQKAAGRVSFVADPSVLAAHPEMDPLVEPGDTIYIPQRPSTVAVLGEVMQPGTYLYQPGQSLEDYVQKAGGYAQFSNEKLTFVVMPDGTARKLERSLFGFDNARLPPGSAIVVPRDLTPIDTRQIILDVTGILSSLAVSLASLAVISRN